MAIPTLPVPCELLTLLELARGSGCGSEIWQRFTKRAEPLPKPSKVTFYCALRRLVRDGLAERTLERRPIRRGRLGRPRKFFVITELGRAKAQALSDGLRGSLLPPSILKKI